MGAVFGSVRLIAASAGRGPRTALEVYRAQTEPRPKGADGCDRPLFLPFLPLVVPRHLNGLKLAFVRFLRIVAEVFELRNPFVHLREPHFQRIDIRMCFVERKSDIFGLVPSE